MTDETLPDAGPGEPDLAADLAAKNTRFDGTFDFNGLSARLDELLSDEGRANLPSGGSEMDRIFYRVTAALAESKRPVVPVTDTSKPTLAPVAPDLSALPAHARIARGYRTA